jgi:hypothetical protein
MTRHTTAHYFLEGLVDLGVDYIFGIKRGENIPK